MFAPGAAAGNYLSDVIGGRDATNNYQIQSTTVSDMLGKVTVSDAAGNLQTSLRFTPQADLFKGVSAGGSGATVRATSPSALREPRPCRSSRPPYRFVAQLQHRS